MPRKRSKKFVNARSALSKIGILATVDTSLKFASISKIGRDTACFPVPVSDWVGPVAPADLCFAYSCPILGFAPLLGLSQGPLRFRCQQFGQFRCRIAHGMLSSIAKLKALKRAAVHHI